MSVCEKCPKIAYYGKDIARFCKTHKEVGMINVVALLCTYEGCVSTSRAFGFVGRKGTHCKKHAETGMVNVANKLCEHRGCLSTCRAFDVLGGKGRFCKDHALSTMVNVVSVRCENSECSKTSRNFDIPGGKGRFCKEHASCDMVDVRNSKCQYTGCRVRANYSIKGEPVKFCSKHKISNMCNRNSCIVEHCIIGANYNYPTETTSRYCSTHKLDGMVNLRVRICKYPNCKKYASFGVKTPQFCKGHADDGMVNLVANLCSHDRCDITASYNHPGERPMFCKSHSEEDMICVIGKGCQYTGCSSKSKYYDIPGGKGRFCTKHKEPGMIDVSNPRCEECNILASYGIPGNKKSRCTKHRKAGMITKPKARCVICRKPAFYGKSFVPRHCEAHKTPDDENLIERKCSSCQLVMILDKNNKCEYCDPIRFETNRLAKQNALMDYLNKRGLKGDSTDIMIDRGQCGRERPDRTFDFGDKIVILECDEHQHRDRQCVCEQTRMVNISQSYGGMPVYFIRWNPDHYVSTNPDPVVRRYKRVADAITEIRDGKSDLPNALLSVMYMYYDNWIGVVSWDVITPFNL